ncbi:MAG: alpha/beta fold hydrolase [Myxococcales bacterium]
MNRAAAPFALGEGPDVCLLLHGLTGSPGEVRPLGEALAAAGMRVVAPLLPGHGTRPTDLAAVTRSDLLEAAASALAGLSGARRVFLGGLSAGALLALRLAARTPGTGAPAIAALALLAPAIRFSGSSWAFAEVLGRFPAPGLVIGKGARGIVAPIPAPVDAPGDGELPAQMRPDGSYTAIPLSWARELRLLSREALDCAPGVRAPALILHGGRDDTASPEGARLLTACLGSNSIRLRVFPESGHVLPLDRDSPAVCSAVVSFFREA